MQRSIKMSEPIDLTHITNSDLAMKAIEWMKENFDVQRSETYYLLEVTSNDGSSAIIVIHQDPNNVDFDYLMSTRLSGALYFANNQEYYDKFCSQFGISDKAVLLNKGDF